MDDTLASLFSLEGRTAVVTGATSGIGAMVARSLLVAGAKVVVVGRDPQRAAAKADDLRPIGRCEGMGADVATAAGRDHLVGELARRAPEVSILVNNAGALNRNPFGEYGEDQWDEVYGTNVKAPFFLTQALHPRLKANASHDRPAHVLNIGSVAGLAASSPDSWAYGGSKAAVHHLTRVLARKLAPDAIRVNAVAPGLFPSKMTERMLGDEEARARSQAAIPVGRLGEPEDIGGMVVAILCNRYMTGSVVCLDGGWSL